MITFIENLLAKKPIIMQLARFIAIGFINTAIDFTILNIISEYFGIKSGIKLGGVNIFGFVAAVIQSYYWNKYWTFSTVSTSLLKNISRLCLIGGLGALILLLTVAGARFEMGWLYHFGLLVMLILVQLGIWHNQHFNLTTDVKTTVVFGTFILVSVIGLVINSSLLTIISSLIEKQGFLLDNQGLIRNIAKVCATVVSLGWNFIGYKLLVFKK